MKERERATCVPSDSVKQAMCEETRVKSDDHSENRAVISRDFNHVSLPIIIFPCLRLFCTFVCVCLDYPSNRCSFCSSFSLSPRKLSADDQRDR